MATANSPPSSGREAAAGLSLSLSSNNPFRNRAASPASPASPFDDPPPRPVSRNPFLDAPPPVRSPGAMSTQSDPKSLTAEDIFDSLTLDDNKTNKPNQPPPSQQRPAGTGPSDPKRPENQRPPQGSNRHRPTRSQEEALRARKLQGGPPARPSQSPQRRPQRRPRRNSESSVMDLNTLTEDERKMIEARRRERRRAEAREAAARDGKAPAEGSSREKHRDGKPREGSESREPRKPRDKAHRPSRRMDIIDQLDATSIYGTGLFHHDGPFDALNPHRNRSGRKAPMQAFPKDSMNMSLGGSGPLNKVPDHATFMGNHDEEAFRDWANSKKSRNGASSTEVPIFDPISRGEVVHGDESVGLGTSTFLEGTPAARAAIAQQAQDEATMGLQRKKSLAQRMRPFKGSREYGQGRMHPGGPGMRSPDGVQSAGLQSTTSGTGEANPFFNEFSKGEENISVRREGALSPTSPPGQIRRGSAGAPLERRVTTDATPSTDETAAPKPSGFIGRMKSLKGPRKPKNPEPPADEPPSYPGTAV